MATAGMAYLERIVVKPTWKQILLELIDQNRIDPWDVDIVRLADEFMARARQLQALDLGMHANVILAAAILLKYKSEYLKCFAAPPVAPLPAEADADNHSILEIPQLSLVGRIPPKRQITVDELMAEMERVLKYESAEMKRTPKGAVTEIIDLSINADNLEKRMADVLARIRENTDESGFATFSSLITEKTNLEVIYTLLSVLHLVQSRTADVYQEKLFGEILVCLVNANEKGEKGSGSDDGAAAKSEKREEIEMLNH